MSRTNFATLLVLCIGVAGYAVLTYAFGPAGKQLHPEMSANFAAHALGIKTHIFASALALLLGPFQFSAALRTRRAALHRWMGRVYLGVGVLVGGLAGLAMSVHAFGGMPAKMGFGALAVAWLYTGFRAYAAVRGGDFAAHRRWMIRNFALSLAAVTLRIYLPASFVLKLPFELAYPVIAWMCWVPNLLFAEWRVRRRVPPA